MMNRDDIDTGSHLEPPKDELDAMLRQWHDVNAERAVAGREALLARIAGSSERAATNSVRAAAVRERIPQPNAPARASFRLSLPRFARLAASITILGVIATLLVPISGPQNAAHAGVVFAPEAGRLDALDDFGNVLGPCALKHTDVNVDISGHFSRVTVTQQYHNPYDRKIEAVYTFPLSHRSAVDRMRMIIGDRVVEGEVKERETARQIYEAAREAGYVASLLEQERPNIFTQNVANIEPDATINIEISYIEILEQTDGQFTFDFPMAVGPRYVPGSPSAADVKLPNGLQPRIGVVLLGPAQTTLTEQAEVEGIAAFDEDEMHGLLSSARPIAIPFHQADQAPPIVQTAFEARYADGSIERGTLHSDNTGQLNGRWFLFDRKATSSARPGTGGFWADTDQVPDASRITPMPVKPPNRAGHDISVTVNIDTGGPAILGVESSLHTIINSTPVAERDNTSRQRYELAAEREIPNRDFVLSWRTDAERIAEATFAHTDHRGKFFTLILDPPARVNEADIAPRELVFVMDTSGSMSGQPIEKSKAVISRAIDSMRDRDTFNIITFAGDTHILWESPRPATKENRDAAQAFVNSRSGSGGTEMMKAINAALQQNAAKIDALTPEQLANLPADGREATVIARLRDVEILLQDGAAPGVFDIRVNDDVSIRTEVRYWEIHQGSIIDTHEQPDRILTLKGKWETRDGKRIFLVSRATDDPAAAAGDAGRPVRFCLFLTDGYVGNDMAIIDAVKENAATTRVFSFGIGNSVNRYLLESMARAGRGEVEWVLLNADADAAVERFVKRIERPVLTHIELAFSDGLDVTDTIPPLDAIPDLFDERPLIIHGRYEAPGKGELTIRGRTGAGAGGYERVLPLELPREAPEHDVIATLWARAKVEQVMNGDLTAAQLGALPDDVKKQIIALGERFSIMTQYTSFVAVEKSRLTIDGEPMLVRVPIELPQGTQWEGFFNDEAGLNRFDLPIMLDVNVGGGEQVAWSSFSVSPAALFAGEIPAELGQMRTPTGEPWLTPQRKEQVRRAIEQTRAAIVNKDESQFKNTTAGLVVDKITDREAGPATAAAPQVRLRLTDEAAKVAGKMIAPTGDAMQYPDDWPALQLRRSSDDDIEQRRREIADYIRNKGITTLKDPRAVQNSTPADVDPSLPELSTELSSKLAALRLSDSPKTGQATPNFQELRTPDGRRINVDLRISDWQPPTETGVAMQRDYSKLGRPTRDEYPAFNRAEVARLAALQGGAKQSERTNRFYASKAAPFGDTRVSNAAMAYGVIEGFPNYSGLLQAGQTPARSTVGERIEFPWQTARAREDAASAHGGFLLFSRERAPERDVIGGGGGQGQGGGGIFADTGGSVRHKHADAGEVADVINALLAEEGARAAIESPSDLESAEPANTHATSSERRPIVVTADSSTNTLVIDAPPETREALARMATEHFGVAIQFVDDTEVRKPDQLALLKAAVESKLRSGEPLIAEQLAVAIGGMCDEQDLERALVIAELLSTLRPEFEIGKSMYTFLADKEMDSDERSARIAKLSEEALARINSVLRAARIRAVLDARLVPFAEGEGFPDSLVDLYDGPTPADTEWADGGALLSVLLTDTSDATLDTIRGLGVKIKATTEQMKFIVAAVPLGRFDDLAMIAAVRRVEPVRASRN